MTYASLKGLLVTGSSRIELSLSGMHFIVRFDVSCCTRTNKFVELTNPISLKCIPSGVYGQILDGENLELRETRPNSSAEPKRYSRQIIHIH